MARIAAVEAAKWGVKRLGGRRTSRTTLRDLRSRGLVSPFDTGLEKSQLRWKPVTDPARFLAEAFGVD